MFTNTGDTVIVPAYGWRAITNAPQFLKLNVQYCDIDPATGNIDIQRMIDCIHKYKPKAILVVHNFGTLVDVSQLTNACAKYNVATKLAKTNAAIIYAKAGRGTPACSWPHFFY